MLNPYGYQNTEMILRNILLLTLIHQHSLLLLLSYSSHYPSLKRGKNYPIDVKTASLQHICIPEGIEINRTKIIGKLNKAIYGFPFSPKCWFNTLEKSLVTFSFNQQELVYCRKQNITLKTSSTSRRRFSTSQSNWSIHL